MLGQLIAALKTGDNKLDEAFEQFLQMIVASEWMFGQANDVLRGKKAQGDVGDALYAKDQEINRLLRSIRANILTHLSVQRNADIAGCLALMSVAKDAERIGDPLADSENVAGQWRPSGVGGRLQVGVA